MPTAPGDATVAQGGDRRTARWNVPVMTHDTSMNGLMMVCVSRA